ncbi:ParB N-terminal domain-containing protein [Pseudorhodobacter sp.]|uniref:ParB N-terminal domain-containing protein n=1 Tax=Pseudorhodobacter sp. TaxID=1934400 RepID=UPI002648C36F|nr:ParB N-terminal domain-containing protein [Pseudorhodobacter sp.]MDN5785716.1 ParB N-terminal domain-containing protein [Pseudorhodobacter sp.]
MKTTFKTLPLEMIQTDAAKRARSFDPAWAEALAGIISQQGLLNPITVRIVGETYRLVAGLHRLEAMRLMGADSIPAMISAATSDDAARLEEVMENLGRNELIALDRCQHLYELKQVWERMYPQTAHGKASPKGQTLPLSSDAPQIFGFSKATAEKTGLSTRSIKLAVMIWKGLSPASRRRLPGTPLAAKQTELKALAALKIPQQERVLDLIFGPERPDNVAEALDYLKIGHVPDMWEREFHVAVTVAKKWSDLLLDAVLADQEARVIASLKRRGRI